MHHHRYVVALAGALVAAPAFAAKGDGNIDDFLVDVSPAPVAANSFMGSDASPVIDAQSARDLVLAVNPFGTDSSRRGYAIAFTPARSGVVPLAMAGRSYLNGGPAMRLLGAMTLSYAESRTEIGGADYRKNAFAVESSYYLNREEDPIIIGARAFSACGEERRKLERERIDLVLRIAQATNPAERQALQQQKEALDAKIIERSSDAGCVTPARWNANKVSLSYGAGWIRPTATPGDRLSLGKSFVASAIFGVGADGAVHMAIKRSSDELDLSTLGSAPQYKGNTLVGLRYTKGESGLGTRDLRLLAEVSNARKTKATLSNTAFMYAVGVDKKVADGLWLEFRLGRNRTIDETGTQTTSLLSLNWTPSATLFAK